MKSIIIVSKCLRVINFKSQIFYEFHFRGVCEGQLIKKVKLLQLDRFELVPGEAYLVQVRDHKINGSVLEGKIMKFRLLEECFDRS